jgi:linolenate 9R-lipoxygenase
MMTKNAFLYAGEIGKDVPAFDPTKPLPANVQPTPRFIANFGLKLLPAMPFGSIPLLGIAGALETMGRNIKEYMPPNLTRCRPDKFSDAFFVERRLNGFNPGKLNRVQGQEWQYAVRYDCGRYTVEPGGILPSLIEARFSLSEQQLSPHSIQFTLNDETEIHRPGDSEWEWAKRLFRCAEFVFQEIQSHLGRTHMNMGQYAMPYYRNVVNNPIRLLLEPHLDGLLHINSLGASLISGNKGFIPETSSLTPADVNSVLKEEIKQLSYHNWSPARQALPDPVANNYFDRAAIAMWKILETYVDNFFASNQTGIQTYWPEIQAMSDDLVMHSILKPELGTLAIETPDDLRQLCVYIIYFSSFFHSWVNNKQYEDGGDVSYAAIGIWDPHHPDYDPITVAKREAKQTTLLWMLSHVRYNPIMEVGSPALKDALWKHKAEIEPGIPLENIMMSINI